MRRQQILCSRGVGPTTFANECCTSEPSLLFTLLSSATLPEPSKLPQYSGFSNLNLRTREGGRQLIHEKNKITLSNTTQCRIADPRELEGLRCGSRSTREFVSELSRPTRAVTRSNHKSAPGLPFNRGLDRLDGCMSSLSALCPGAIRDPAPSCPDSSSTTPVLLLLPQHDEELRVAIKLTVYTNCVSVA